MMQPSTASARRNFLACVVLIPLTAIAVIGRFAVRRSLRQAPLGADWMCLASWSFFCAFCTIIIDYILNKSKNGSFDFNIALPQPELRDESTTLLKATFEAHLFFGFTITSVKLSILWLYYTLFRVNKNVKICIQTTAVVCVLWLIIVTFLVIFQCWPVEAYWVANIEGSQCHSIPRILLGYEITNLFLDVLILCIPVGITWRLELPIQRRLAIAGTFLLGGFVCVASIERIKATWNPPNINEDFDFPSIMLWSTLQLGAAILCSCLPTFKPLLPALNKPIVHFRTWYGSKWSPRPLRKTESTAQRIVPDRRDSISGWDTIGDRRSQTWVYSSYSDECGHQLQDISCDAAYVNREVEVV
ncbi:uncharacterized protein F4822DRAFT_291326 [Hypoxylon trugodes]|uniref:uncharacterized protein n=1 Tax=Hypoxylon trugodes TaxID=326681 RepID=UPI00219C6193|nr:uncharacterized protein F4822DRAFT_291326 [Hypoxylon trugodes]KAI1387739.1 hypothetical protein F4822DRAFT_291326 [Hypoxylon trugodes]